MKRTFEDITGPLALDLRLAAGRIVVAAAETTRLDVDLQPMNDAAEALLDAAVIDLRERSNGRQLLVEVPERRGLRVLGRGPEFELRVSCPRGADVTARSSSGDFEGTGVLGSLAVKTASGDVEAEWVD